ncbi:MAG: urea carboxylase-associated family protein [Actinomycetota bacterium]|nr:urea carboxylase-associated family protein [Actinomycetota bacterium]
MEITRHRLEPQTGFAFELKRGQVLRIIDPEGEQVSDVVAFAREDHSERLSSGRSLDYNNTIYLTTGHVLYSNRSNPMFVILEDRVGKHDFLLTPCSPETFEILYEDHEGYHPSCLENLTENLRRFGIVQDDIPTAFNVFMNVDILPSGELRIGHPLSKPGDFVDLRAEMDLTVGITACSAEKSNNNSLKPIDLKVYEREGRFAPQGSSSRA